jgi:hypothetical protein
MNITDDNMDAAVAAFERAEAANDADAMLAILNSAAYRHAMVRAAQINQSTLLRPEGSADDRISRLVYYSVANHSMQVAQNKMAAARLRELRAIIERQGSRLDRQAQQLSALAKQLAALERKPRQ